MPGTTTLSAAQHHVVDRLRQGWELGLDLTLGGTYWLQQGGCGCGGQTERVHANTAHALYTKGIIVEASRQFPLATYRLANEAP